jgi:hypothetical protein
MADFLGAGPGLAIGEGWEDSSPSSAAHLVGAGASTGAGTLFGISSISVGAAFVQRINWIPQGEPYDVKIYLRSLSDHMTGVEGVDLSIFVSKSGPFVYVSRDISEIGGGWYKISLTGEDTDTLGDLLIRAQGVGTDPSDISVQVVTPLWQQTIESSYSAQDLLRLMGSVLLGKVTGAGSGTEKFRDLEDTKDRVVAKVDNRGNRTSITRDAS